MSPRLGNVMRAILALGAFASAVASMYFMYQAGCTAELKTGVSGDTQRAMEIEGDGMLLAWLAILLSAVMVGSWPKLVFSQRIALPIFTVIVGAIGLTLLGLNFETRGVQNCLA